MKHADLHLHTCYSHGVHTPWEMYVAANNRGLGLIGFSEHSPRPAGFNYTHEYREHLTRYFPRYINEVLKLKEYARQTDGCQVLLGLEMDWLNGELDFITRACRAHDYSYLIGSVHFIDKWGFDDGAEPWQKADRETCFNWYERYFASWHDMLASGLFQIAAHPDLIKIFSVDAFSEWLQKPESLAIINNCLLTLQKNGMAMEISSAGLRKACKQIYPAPPIMRIAAELHLNISLASDAHNMRDTGADFDALIEYAKSFGFTSQTIFDHGQTRQIPF